MSRGHSLVPGMEARSFHTAVRDEGHPEVAGIGVECGGGALPHTLQEARLGVWAAQSSGPAEVEPAWALWSSFLKPHPGDDVSKKVLFLSSREP